MVYYNPRHLMKCNHLLSLSLFFCAIGVAMPAKAAEAPISRADAFSLIWHSIAREPQSVSEKPFSDVSKNNPLYADLLYAKNRGIIGDYPDFRPLDPIDFETALTWIFRTRSVEPADSKADLASLKPIEITDVPALLTKYGMASQDPSHLMTSTLLLQYMRNLDEKLMREEHEVSLYSEKFHGAGTAFGETFDMNALTAAHRTFPHNTLVRVTNIANEKSVVVRINDRGPFVAGRNMDLSLAAFTTIADRALGTITARFERMGDARIVMRCNDDRFQRRITKDVLLNPGIPWSLALGKSLTLRSSKWFVVDAIEYPDGTISDANQWIGQSESFDIIPSIIGTYAFHLRDALGHRRTMHTEVVDCSSFGGESK